MNKMMMILAGLMFVAVNASAYDPDALDYSFGTVKKVSATEITLEEFDFEGDLEKTVETTYVINAETELDNVDTIGDLKVEEDVEVYFIEENGKKIAVALAKDEGLEDLSTEGFDLKPLDGEMILDEDMMGEELGVDPAEPATK